jgi:hypothetical protein
VSSVSEKKSVLVAIHQPNFFPWLGYFDKIARADVFVFMDNVQFPRSSRGTWINRVKLNIGGRAAWVTCPVKRPEGLQIVHEVTIDDAQPWRKKLAKSVECSYGRTPFFSECFPLFMELIEHPQSTLVDFNVNAIRKICESLGMDTGKLAMGSDLNCKSSSTDLLIEMTEAVGGSSYLCGGGAEGYQENEKITATGVKLVYQNFAHPMYPQWGAKEFVPGLCIMDAIFNLGFEATAAIFRRRE